MVNRREAPSVPPRPALVVDHHGGALLAAPLAAQLRLQFRQREIAPARDQMTRIKPVRMPAPPTEHPKEPPRLDRVPQGLDGPDPMSHHKNN